MKLAQGDMWSALPTLGANDLFCITTNAELRRQDGALVMGRGIALQAAQRFPGLQQEAGRRIAEHLTLAAKHGRPERFYGLLIIRPGDIPGLDFNLGLFQVKWHWKEQADARLIARSVHRLRSAISPDAPGVTPRGGIRRPWAGAAAHLNFPGVGNGRLARADVLPLLEPLPDCVTVWELP